MLVESLGLGLGGRDSRGLFFATAKCAQGGRAFGELARASHHRHRPRALAGGHQPSIRRSRIRAVRPRKNTLSSISAISSATARRRTMAGWKAILMSSMKYHGCAPRLVVVQEQHIRLADMR
jgi:hypothetical protein